MIFILSCREKVHGYREFSCENSKPRRESRPLSQPRLLLDNGKQLAIVVRRGNHSLYDAARSIKQTIVTRNNIVWKYGP